MFTWLKVRQIAAQLKDPNAMVRERAVKALAELKRGQCVKPICQALFDTHEDVQVAAAEALRRQPSVDAVDDLLAALEAKKTAVPVQQAIIRTLERIGPEAVPKIVARLADSACQHQSEMAMALGKIKDPQAVQPLIDALQDDELRVRKESIHALSLLEDRRAVPALLGMLSETRWLLRAEACEALGRLGDLSALPALIERLKDDKWLVQMSAVKALGRFRDPRVVPALAQALHGAHEDVRRTVADILGGLADPAAIPVLFELLRDPDSAGAAVDGLRRLLSTSADRLSTCDLQALSKLSDVEEIHYTASDPSDLRTVTTHIQSCGTRPVDCSSLRSLAQSALSMR